MAFNIDMSPLERSSLHTASTLRGLGQGFAEGRKIKQEQNASDVIKGLVSAAAQGDTAAIERLYSVDPITAKQLEQRMQSQQQQASDSRALATVDVIEKMHLAPKDQQEAMFNQFVDDDRFDIDEDDRAYFLDDNARKAVVAQVKGKEYADNFFAPVKKQELGVKDRLAINKDFTSLTKDTKLIRNTAEDLSKLAGMVRDDGNVSGPSSIAMVFKFMKALDPTSVVRESEFATAENSSGVPENVRNIYNKLVNGGKLGAVQVNEFVDTAKGLANSAIDSSTSEVNGFLNTFEGTIPDGFRGKMLNRIPKRFEVKDPVKTKKTVIVNDDGVPEVTVKWSDMP